MDNPPKVGAVMRIVLPGGIERRGKIIAVDPQDGDVFVRWVDYDLPNEWLPLRYIQG